MPAILLPGGDGMADGVGQWKRRLAERKRWLLAAIATVVIGFLSMGALGMALLFVVELLLPSRHGPSNTWHGDWLWPATITIGMGWSIGVLLAGEASLRLRRRGVVAAWRVPVCIVVLWAWAWLLWWVTLAQSPMV